MWHKSLLLYYAIGLKVLLLNVVLTQEPTTEVVGEGGDTAGEGVEGGGGNTGGDGDGNVETPPSGSEKPDDDDDEHDSEPPDGPVTDFPFPAITTRKSRPKKKNEPTSVPQSAIDSALFLEPGEYSTMSFSYFNDQFMGFEVTKPFGYQCHDNYMRCLLSQTVRVPICAVHQLWRAMAGVRELPSICDMYHYNCRRRFRYFWVLKHGNCGYLWSSGRFHYYRPIYAWSG